MLIGENFEKIEFQLFGLELLEPNGFIGDILLALFAFFYAYRISKFEYKSEYFSNWKTFYIIFGISSIFGSLGHLLFNYWGLPGKYPAWFLIVTSVFFIERATILLIDNEKLKKLFTLLSRIKLVLAYLGVLLTILYVDMSVDYSKGMKVPTTNTTIGLIFCLGVYGYIFKNKIHNSFKYFIYSVLIMIPAALFQSFKINLHPWFDKNDASHLILIFGISFYFVTLNKYNKYLSLKK